MNSTFGTLSFCELCASPWLNPFSFLGLSILPASKSRNIKYRLSEFDDANSFENPRCFVCFMPIFSAYPWGRQIRCNLMRKANLASSSKSLRPRLKKQLTHFARHFPINHRSKCCGNGCDQSVDIKRIPRRFVRWFF